MRPMRLTGVALLGVILLAACGTGAQAPASSAASSPSAAAKPAAGSTAPASAKPAASAVASAGAKPAASNATPASAKPAASAAAPASGKPTPSAAASGAGGLAQMRLGQTDINFSNVFFPMAQDLGIFKKYGVDLTAKAVSNDTARFAALQAKEVEVITGGTSTVTGILRGFNVVTVANSADRMLYYFVGSPNIKSAADLKGKVVSAGNFNTATDYCGRESLRQLGLSASDVQYTQFQSNSQVVGAAIIEGRVQAGCINVDTYLLTKDQGLNLLYDPTKGDIRFPWANLVMPKDYLQSHQTETKGFLKGLIEAIHYFKTHPDEAKAAMAKGLKMDDPKQVAALYDGTIQYLLDDPTPSAQAQQQAIDLVAASDDKAKGLKGSDLVDPTLMNQIKAEGFFQQLGIPVS